MSELSERKKRALKEYGEWRPRIGRGASWAATAGLLTNLSGNRKVSIPAATAAGVAGMGDKMLEEEVKKSRKLKAIVKDSFEQSKTASSIASRPAWAQSPLATELGNVQHNAVIGTLFSRKARVSAAARKQLGNLFANAGENSFGASLQVSADPRSAAKAVVRVLKG